MVSPMMLKLTAQSGQRRERECAFAGLSYALVSAGHQVAKPTIGCLPTNLDWRTATGS